jgi:YD repeat-containing protein
MRHKVAAIGLLLLSASSAYAHVTVQPKQATAKGFQEFVVRVPTEKDTPTLSVRMVFPEGFEVLRFRPAPGWKYEVERDAAGRITGVTWSGNTIGREEYEQFSFMARAANPGTYQLNAYQTYGSGEVVGWVNPQDPQPAPKITIVAAASPGGGGGTDPFAASAAGLSGAAPPAAGGGRAPLVLASASVVLSLAALVLAGRRRR